MTTINYSELSAQDLAMLTVQAKKDPAVKPLISQLLRSDRKLNRKTKRQLRRADKLDPNSEAFNPKFAERIAIRQKNQELRAQGLGKVSASKLSSIESWIKAAGVEGKVLPDRFAKIQVKALNREEGLTGYRATISLREPDGSLTKRVRTLTLSKATDKSLDEMKASCEEYCRTVIRSFVA